MRKIPLTKGYVALVDDEDFERLSAFRWFAWKGGTHSTFYAVRNITKGESGSRYMHRMVVGLSDPKVKIDHRDGDGLHNFRSNLRIATTSQNGANRKTGGLKGVHKYLYGNRQKPWVAQITVDYQKRTIGYFASPEEAARAYDEAAREAFGEFACVNFGEQS